ncbi:hypothetical protein T439DRAFT_356437 [Meredithblackwellia eburnea MCA 4105]
MGQPRRILCVFITLLTLFLLGTVVVLSTVVAYFGVDSRDVIQEHEMLRYERLAAQASRRKHQQGGAAGDKDQRVVVPPPSTPSDDDNTSNSDTAAPVRADSPPLPLAERAVVDRALPKIVDDQDEEEDTAQPRIPRIVHQTWMTEDIPDRWAKVRQGCQALHPDYEYILWTDASSREFIAEQYPWFLATFDGYRYPIQRADAIRYFILHYYGGIYMDLDVGCQQPIDPLLYFPVILPATIPVGVSNDIMLSEKGHPFMDLVIHNLVTFNHQYGTNYPTVMFSTGPMFLSAQYGLWPKEDVDAPIDTRQVRILPRRWYGKNAPEGERELAYFSHFYGSSWHADDAGFITFLGKFGLALMYAGFTVALLGIGRILWSKRSSVPFLKKSSRKVGPIALPFHVPDPFARPGTAGSRPSSPFGGSRSGTPGGRRRDSIDPAVPPPAPRGVLYYLPVWFAPSSQQGWAQYIPGMAYEDGTPDHQYQPIPFSRPPSPNNSILHAPGAHHDGAFDGVVLHSIGGSSAPAPRPTPSSSNNSQNNQNPTTPTTPSPPVYSTLKNWGSSLFRPSSWSNGSSQQQQQQHQQPSPTTPHPQKPFFPIVAPTPRHGGHAPRQSRAADLEQQFDQHQHGHQRTTSTSSATARSGSAGGGHGGGNVHARSRSPLPPSYSLTNPSEEGFVHFGAAARNIKAEASDVFQHRHHGAGGSGAGNVATADLIGVAAESGGEGEVEDWAEGREVEEVDRLLSEMAPEVKGSKRDD